MLQKRHSRYRCSPVKQLVCDLRLLVEISLSFRSSLMCWNFESVMKAFSLETRPEIETTDAKLEWEMSHLQNVDPEMNTHLGIQRLSPLWKSGDCGVQRVLR